MVFFLVVHKLDESLWLVPGPILQGPGGALVAPSLWRDIHLRWDAAKLQAW